MKRLFDINKILILAAVFLSLASCREKIELKLDTTYTRLVVEGSITDEAKAHLVVLTLSGDYLTDKPSPRVEGATVEISDGKDIYVLQETEPGVYKTDPSVKGIQGVVYTLTIKNVDVNRDGEKEVYTASDLLKHVMTIDSMAAEMQKPITNPPVYKVIGWGQEPPTPGDCYQWMYYINGKLQTDTLSKTFFTDDTFVNGSYFPGIPIFYYIDAIPGDTITVETRSLSREYYNFLVTLMLETVWNGGGVAGPPANIKGNISNGGLGYFSAHSVSKATAIVP